MHRGYLLIAHDFTITDDRDNPSKFGVAKVHCLLICRTCPRDVRSPRLPCTQLALRLSAIAQSKGVPVLRVNCLGACLEPCAIALDSTGQQRMRFSGLTPNDEPAIEELLSMCQQSSDGYLDVQSIPHSLRGALSACSPSIRKPAIGNPRSDHA